MLADLRGVHAELQAFYPTAPQAVQHAIENALSPDPAAFERLRSTGGKVISIVRAAARHDGRLAVSYEIQNLTGAPVSPRIVLENAASGARVTLPVKEVDGGVGGRALTEQLEPPPDLPPGRYRVYLEVPGVGSGHFVEADL